jgi:hypothetical protein
MSSNMSRRPPPPEPDDPDVPDVPEDRPVDDEDEEEVEYFVEVAEDSAVWTSVPKSVQSSQTSSSAPSTFTRFGSSVSAPHISH